MIIIHIFSINYFSKVYDEMIDSKNEIIIIKDILFICKIFSCRSEDYENMIQIVIWNHHWIVSVCNI